MIAHVDAASPIVVVMSLKLFTPKRLLVTPGALPEPLLAVLAATVTPIVPTPEKLESDTVHDESVHPETTTDVAFAVPVLLRVMLPDTSETAVAFVYVTV